MWCRQERRTPGAAARGSARGPCPRPAGAGARCAAAAAAPGRGSGPQAVRAGSAPCPQTAAAAPSTQGTLAAAHGGDEDQVKREYQQGYYCQVVIATLHSTKKACWLNKGFLEDR